MRFNTAGPCLADLDRRDGIPEPEHRVAFEAAVTPSGRSVGVMRA